MNKKYCKENLKKGKKYKYWETSKKKLQSSDSTIPKEPLRNSKKLVAASKKWKLLEKVVASWILLQNICEVGHEYQE